MLQYFNTSWIEITRKIPELAEAGYESLWLPPPTKGSGGLSVGYDLWDRFDLGSKDQRGSVRTRYGTEAELLDMVRTAHRFGIRVYFDNVMNHNAFDVPGYNAYTPIDLYPGMLPEDFHLRRTEDGFYRKWDNTRDWNDAWQVQNLGLADLIDIATEPGSWNNNHGAAEGDRMPKIEFVRHPDKPEYYCYLPSGAGQKHSAGQGTYVGFGKNNGITESIIAQNASFYQERVEDMLHRAARWQIDRTKADGLRLDAVKHTPADFFGATYGADKNSSNYGYTGQVQLQFNLSRGFSDWSNHRDTVFDTEKPRDDAMLFGEHLGQPPAYGPYIDAGMRLVDNDLRGTLNDRLGNPSASLAGLQNPGGGGFAPDVAVMHAQSHDNDYANRRELQHALYFTRAGLGLVYTDGNYHAETLGESGGAFPRHANTAFLGQWGDPRIPNLLKIHQNFGRGYQQGRSGGSDLVVYERLDKRENPAMSDSAATTMLVAINDNYSAGTGISGGTSFASTPNSGSENNPNTSDEYLYQYARGYGSQVGFYTYASALGSVTVDKGSYFVFAPRTPEESDLWKNAGGAPVTILQGGQAVGTVKVTRRDGPNGDPAFNPYGLADANGTDYAYQVDIPRVTSSAPLKFVVRTDGSAKDVLLKLDGGIDLNGTRPAGNTDPFYRDNPPALSWDMKLGYENPVLVRRMFSEKFAAKDTTRNQTGSLGSETYVKTIGSGAVLIIEGPAGANNYNTEGGEVASFLYHDPGDVVGGTPAGGWPGGTAPLQYVENASTITLWAKPNGVGAGFRMYCYHTADGSNPEGAGGSGTGTTSVAEMNWSHNQGSDDWWTTATVPKPAAGSVFKYKIGIFKEGAASIYPSGPDSVAKKKRMMTVHEIDGFNPATVVYSPHNDYVSTATGLQEGFHVLRARPFLERDGKASLHNTFTQTFYYDAARPQGQIVFPANDGDTVGGSEYGVVVRTDASTSEVWYRVTDGDSSNDDTLTGANNGNGAWVRATEVTATPGITPANPAHTREWRFNYVNIPPSGTATLQVRLKELSSSADNDLGDAAGHFTTLNRSVTTAGPDRRMFIAYPPSDGDTIDDLYLIKVYFSKALADGLDDNQLKARFLVRFGANDGWPAGASVLEPAALGIVRNETDDYHALAFRLPNLYNGVPGFLHRVEVTHDRPDPQVDMVATRRVTAAPSTKPRVTILQPQEFDSNGKPVEIVLPDGPGGDSLAYTVRVETDVLTTEVSLSFTLGSGTLTPVDQDPALPGIQPLVQGTSAFWDFIWSIVAPGQFRLSASAVSPGGTNSDTRNATVVLRQLATADPEDIDDDDDGLADVDEGTPVPLPNGWPSDHPGYKPNPEQWTNGDVHVHNAYGLSDPLMPDSDGDGLPDGLEVGWRQAGPATNVSADSNADGWPNFIGDLDPPFYNTLDNLGKVPGVNSASEGGDRAKQLQGTLTNPGKPDTDGDGLMDGIEDANRNGWTDGDGASLAANVEPSLARNWPNGRMDPGETWLETSPVDADTDDDGLSDGHGEDKDFSGNIRGDTNGDRVWQAPETWVETDPLKADTDGDGLPDGWEDRHRLNALDNGTTAYDGSVPNPDNGAGGDPDMDGITNAQELLAGTDPRVNNSIAPQPGEGRIIIGPVAESDARVFGSVVNRQEFTDWTVDDLVVLDEFEGDGSGNQGGDTYLANDGFDSSRDLVAFYARDGGDSAAGGTGEFYFRADFHDLKAYAEEGNLDLYVVIDSGNPSVGEYALPDQVDTGTEMRWEAVVAVYQSNNGAVFIDTNRASQSNTTVINEDLGPKGVVRRDQNTPNGFLKAWFDSTLDAVEFSVSRQALLDAGWLGDPSTLRFQVFTVRDGTQNNPRGAGDIGGRSDIRDTIYDDWLAEDYWRDQNAIAQNSVLQTGFGYLGPDRGRRAKVMLLTHTTEPILSGSETQQRINDGAGAGYHRPLDVHEAYLAKMGLHLTPTLASAIQWASVDPAAGKPWRDGPAFNARIGRLARDGVIELIGTTFADAPLPYFSQSWLQDNVALAGETMERIYGVAPSTRVFWIPERVVDQGVLAKVSALGATHVFLDQFRHISVQFGRSSALLDDGYRVNRINGLNAFVINDQAATFRFRNTDSGLDINLRQLLSRKARSGEQHQLVILASDWGEFRVKAAADAYDANVRWLASRPWVEMVGPDQVARGAVDLSLPPDGSGDTFASLERGSVTFQRKIAPAWLDHASQLSYDFWWFGSAQEESLRDKVFEIRPGVPLSRPGDDFFGVQEFGAGGAGIARDAWNTVAPLPDSGLKRLARGTYHAATWLAGWHEEDNGDLRTFSTGDFINPDTTFDNLSAGSKHAQSQVRFAAVHQLVAAWAAAPPQVASAVEFDADMDGEVEYLLQNDRVFAVFEAVGGRCTAAWVRANGGGEVRQVVGNFLSYSGSETEHEGASNQNPDRSVLARRTSAFKDWWANGSGGGTNQYVNAIYSVAPAVSGTGWTFTAPAGAIVKTIRLAAGSDTLAADYQLNGGVDKLFVRFGLSPDLDELLVSGQRNLSGPELVGGGVELSTLSPLALTTARVIPGSGVTWQAGAVDDDFNSFDSVAMRNQAQVHQVEVESQSATFTVNLGLSVVCLDCDGDGLPAEWEAVHNLDDNDPGGENGAHGDPDGDGIPNLAEWLTGLNPGIDDRRLYPRLTAVHQGGGIRLSFPTIPARIYQLQVSSDLLVWEPSGAPVDTTGQASPGTLEVDETRGPGNRFYRVTITAP